MLTLVTLAAALIQTPPAPQSVTFTRDGDRTTHELSTSPTLPEARGEQSMTLTRTADGEGRVELRRAGRPDDRTVSFRGRSQSDGHEIVVETPEGDVRRVVPAGE